MVYATEGPPADRRTDASVAVSVGRFLQGRGQVGCKDRLIRFTVRAIDAAFARELVG